MSDSQKAVAAREQQALLAAIAPIPTTKKPPEAQDGRGQRSGPTGRLPPLGTELGMVGWNLASPLSPRAARCIESPAYLQLC
jgi:hypothetical protein